MTKIEKLIDSGFNDGEFISFTKEDLISMMREYAEFYAKKCLEIVAKEASANFECIGAVLGAENVNPYVEEESILKIKLPEHE